MSLHFLSPWLLIGLLTLAIPIIIHLILRKKPKHQWFPALRFLQQRQRTNLQKLRLRHLLLLTLRLLLFGLIVTALARPLLSGGPSELAGRPDLAVVFLFDTSGSMDYVHEGNSRLKLARDIATEFLNHLTSGSLVAVFDSGEAPSAFVPVRDAGKWVQNRRIHLRNRPITTTIDQVWRTLEQAPPKLPILFCIFSDRTAASWDADLASLLPKKAEMEEKLKNKINTVYFDLGVKEPRNLAITQTALRLPSGQSVALEDLRLGVSNRIPVQIQATVEVTGTSVNTELQLFVEGKLHDQKTVNLTAKPLETIRETVLFKELKIEGQHSSGEVRLKSSDALEVDNARFWTMRVIKHRVLIISDRESDADDWRIALNALEEANLPIETKVIQPNEAPAQIFPDQYQAVCLLNVARPSTALWETLNRYVTMGGGLLLLPGADAEVAAYTSPMALALVPARLKAQKKIGIPGTFLSPVEYESHPILGMIQAWQQPLTPGQIYRFWDVDPIPNQSKVILPYNWENRPALVERVFDRKQVQGRVLLFTTALYRRNDRQWEDWNNFLSGSGMWIGIIAMPYVSLQYLMDTRAEPNLFTLGEGIGFPLPAHLKLTDYLLTGPQVATLKVQPTDRTILLPELQRPGNYQLSDPTGKAWSRSFSLNLAQKETQLVQGKPEVSTIEAILGEGTVREWNEKIDLGQLVRDKLGQAPQTELLPLLMLLLLFILAFENLIANRFYRSSQENAQ